MVELKANPAKQPKIPHLLHECMILFKTVVGHLKLTVWVCGFLIAPASVKCSCFAFFKRCAFSASNWANQFDRGGFFHQSSTGRLWKAKVSMLTMDVRCSVIWNASTGMFSTCRRSMLDHGRPQGWRAATHVLLSFFFCVPQGYRWRIYFGAARRCAEWLGVWRL